MEPVSTIVGCLASLAPALTAPTLGDLGRAAPGHTSGDGATHGDRVPCRGVAVGDEALVGATRTCSRRARLSLLVLAQTLFPAGPHARAARGVVLLVIDESLVQRTMRPAMSQGMGMHRDSVRWGLGPQPSDTRRATRLGDGGGGRAAARSWSGRWHCPSSRCSTRRASRTSATASRCARRHRTVPELAA